MLESGSWTGLIIFLILWNNGRVRPGQETPTFFQQGGGNKDTHQRGAEKFVTALTFRL